MANDTPLRTARGRLDALVSELAALPAAISAAQSEVRVEDWMKLNARHAELPALVDAARAELLPLEISAAWQTAEELHRVEVKAAKTAKTAEKAFAAAIKPLSMTASPVEQAEATLRTARASEAAQAANDELQTAREATGHALFAVDQLEAELLALTGEPPQDGPGLRARRSVAGNVVLTPGDVGELADNLSDDVPGSTLQPLVHDSVPRLLFEKGAVPPRWISHRLGDHVFVERPEFGAPTEAEIAMARQREEALERLPIGEPTRLGPGGVPSWMPAGRAR